MARKKMMTTSFNCPVELRRAVDRQVVKTDTRFGLFAVAAIREKLAREQSPAPTKLPVGIPDAPAVTTVQ